MISQYPKFEEISQKVNKEISKEEGEKLLEKIDFTTFSRKEILKFSESEWISDEAAAKYLDVWENADNETSLQIRAYVLLTNIIDKETLQKIVESTNSCRTDLNIVVNDILNNLATANGTREFMNPLAVNVIKAWIDPQDPQISQQGILNLFDGNPLTYLEASSMNHSIIIQLPSWLRVRMTSYKISSPNNKGGIKTWTIYGSNDLSKWELISSVVDDDKLSYPQVENTYPVDEHCPNLYFNSFKISTKTNHNNGKTFIASSFDFSGKVTLNQE